MVFIHPLQFLKSEANLESEANCHQHWMNPLNEHSGIWEKMLVYHQTIISVISMLAEQINGLIGPGT